MSTTMLYKWPGPHSIHGDFFDYIVVNDSDIEQVLADGWKLTTPEAKEASKPKPVEATDDNAAPTRLEMEEKAKELGIKFDGRTTNKRLLEQIDAHYIKAD